MNKPASIRLTQLVPHSPARAWEALTSPDLLARWWTVGDVRPIVGHSFTLDMAPWGLLPCEILAVESQRLLSYSFAQRALGTTVTWQLQPEAHGTHLSLEHSGFDLSSPLAKSAYERMSVDWPTVLASFIAFLGPTSSA